MVVAAGTYRPTATTDRTISFQLKNGVQILGGYAGSTAPDPDARDIVAYAPILSGDIGAAGNKNDNSYHVLYGLMCNTTVHDEFTISGGNANRCCNMDPRRQHRWAEKWCRVVEPRGVIHDVRRMPLEPLGGSPGASWSARHHAWTAAGARGNATSLSQAAKVARAWCACCGESKRISMSLRFSEFCHAIRKPPIVHTP
jgi:hypothetical protein